MNALIQLRPGAWAEWFATVVFLQSTVAIGLAWLLALGLARRRPAVRHGIWFWALASLPLGPLAAMAVERAGLSPITVPLLRFDPSPTEPVPLALEKDDAAAFPRPDWIASLPIRASETSAVVAKTPAAISGSSLTWLRTLAAFGFVVWMIGAVVLLVRLIVGGFALARLKRRARPLEEGPHRGVLDEVRAAFGVTAPPRILVSADLDRPVAAGIIRAAVVLPRSLIATADPRRLRDVLIHECAHVVRRDHLVGLLQRLVGVAFWPQPLLGLLNRELARAREEICDNHVLRGGDRVGYSWTLLEAAEAARGPAPFPTAFGLLSAAWRLEDRIAGILDERRDLMTRSRRGTSIVVMAGFLATAAALAALVPSSRAGGATQGESDVAGSVNQMAEQLKRGLVDRPVDPDRSSLFLLDVESGEATLITDEPEPGLAYCGSPRWSPDGRRILFDASPGTDWRKTHLKSIDLADERLKITDLGPGNCPSFSPDGERIAFLVNSGAAPDMDAGVWVMRKDGSDRKRLDVFGIPLWSPDGRQLLIVFFGSPIRMQIMDVNDWKPRPVNLPGYELHTSPRWAGPGTLVAAAATDEGAAVVLFDVTNPEAGKLKEILWKQGDRLDAAPAHPIFSPATGACVFVGKDANGLALYSVRRGSFGPPRKLEPKVFDDKLAGLEFSPDGRYVLFCANRPNRRAVDSEPSLGGGLRPSAPGLGSLFQGR